MFLMKYVINKSKPVLRRSRTCVTARLLRDLLLSAPVGLKVRLFVTLGQDVDPSGFYLYCFQAGVFLLLHRCFVKDAVEHYLGSSVIR